MTMLRIGYRKLAFGNERGGIWKFRDLLSVLEELGGQGRGLETLLPKHSENSGGNGSPPRRKEALGTPTPQPLRARTPEPEARPSCGPSRGPRTVWDTRGCGRTAAQRRSGPSRRAQGPQDARGPAAGPAPTLRPEGPEGRAAPPRTRGRRPPAGTAGGRARPAASHQPLLPRPHPGAELSPFLGLLGSPVSSLRLGTGYGTTESSAEQRGAFKGRRPVDRATGSREWLWGVAPPTCPSVLSDRGMEIKSLSQPRAGSGHLSGFSH
ncbi:sterile alpha motif domain-containing protein 1 [Equus quagga]|uniref:sterile alpha motif domain-containing protein 1 n=1 Tax=Equus quagga TaxID=89248 RepID=UPI001EE24B02|nr:sterile alpha motif domain-containing protein 1 [Equus quagga]